MEITGILIAGGKSSRMGSNKATLVWQNKTFAEHSLNLLQQFCQHIIISYNSHPFMAVADFVTDIHQNIGPLGGLHATLNRSTTKYNLVLACDLPRLKPDTLQELIKNCQNYDITTFGSNDYSEPLCAVYSKEILPQIDQQITNQNYSLQKLIRSANTNFCELTPQIAEQLRNINTPEDFNSL